MAVNDFTDQNIQDTYQKVVQTDGTNLADGTGSLLPIKFNGLKQSIEGLKISHESIGEAEVGTTFMVGPGLHVEGHIIATGDVIAHQYIVSSSVINVTTQQLSGSTEFGNSADDTHQFIGHITASVNISASGYGHFANLQVPAGGYLRFDDVIGSDDQYILGNENNITVDGDQKVKLIANDVIEVGVATNNIKLTIDTSEGHITALGDGTFSGTVQAEHLYSSDDAEITDDLTVGGSIFVADDIIHAANIETKIGFGDDQISFKVGNITMLDLNEDTVDTVTVGNEEINTHIAGPLTASGHVSCSGIFTTETLNGALDEPTGLEIIGYLSASAGTGSFTTMLYSSGQISASGVISGEGLYISDDAEIVDDLTLGGDIIFDGNTITGINNSGEFDDDDAHIMTSAGINDRFALINANTTGTAGGLSSTLAVSSGGTNATSFADKSVIITQDSGTDTLAAVAMSTNGQLLIGGTSGPAVATLTAGNGIAVTNADGGITIATNLTAGDGLTLNTADIDLDASLTTVTSIKNASLAIGRDDDNLIEFSTDNEIHFKTNGETPVIKMKASGEIEATSLDISGDADVGGALTAVGTTSTIYNSTTSTTGYKLNGVKFLWRDGGADLQVGNDAYKTDIIGTNIDLQSPVTSSIISASGAISTTSTIRGSMPQVISANMGGVALSTTTDTYIPLAEGEIEGTNHDHVRVNLVAPFSGSLRRIVVRSNAAFGTDQAYTASLYVIHDDEVASGKTLAGHHQIGLDADKHSAHALVFDFANQVTGSNVINGGDRVLVSLKSSRNNSQNYYCTTVFAWDYHETTGIVTNSDGVIAGVGGI